MRIRPRIRLKVVLLLILFAAIVCVYLKPQFDQTHIPLTLLVEDFNTTVAAQSKNLVKPLTMKEVNTALKAWGSEEALNAVKTGRVSPNTNIHLHWEGEFPAPLELGVPLIESYDESTIGRERILIRIYLPPKTGRVWNPIVIREIACDNKLTIGR